MSAMHEQYALGRSPQEYARLAREYKFTVMDASRVIEEQQQLVRSIVTNRIDLARFLRRAAAHA